MSSLPVVVVKKRKSLPFFNRHPWVFAGAIERVEGDPAPGDTVILQSYEGKFIAKGLFNPDSNIRVRLYVWRAEEPFYTSISKQVYERDFWHKRIAEAVSLRRQLFPAGSPHTAYRLINSEADGLSGLTVDCFNDWLVMQVTSRALAEETTLATLVEILREEVQPEGIWFRAEKGINEKENLSLTDHLLWGENSPEPMIIKEHGLQYKVDLQQGQKTGFYTDQRENRLAVSKLVSGHRVLDMCCYSGAFGITAAALGGAEAVIAADVSQSAIELAHENAELNGVGDKFQFMVSDAFTGLETLIENGEQFETVILDPPKMTRSRANLKQALRGYHSLNELALKLLPPDGILVTCSCSGLVGRQDFELMLSQVAARSGRNLQILEQRGFSADHAVSVSCPESNYLKCYICRVL